MNHAAHGTLTKSGGCGCGCGGGGSAPARPCSCQKKGCQECETHGLIRPRFFAGQLLTEDDLEALTGYVVSKQRLHTRHLHGEGVVCGLEVSCSPCGGGTVVVRPGYALDCCGNDIVVSCATELDILAMIRQLRIDNRGGHDCGDPCADSKAARRKPSTDASTPMAIRQQYASTAVPAATPPPAPVAPPPPVPAVAPLSEISVYRPPTKRPDEPPTKLFRERYCLYLRYCETPADPVKPFVLDEPCGDGACEFTRVREGYRFELRCPEDHKPAPSLADRIAECTNLDELTSAVKTYEASEARIYQVERAVELVDAGQPLTLAPDDRNRLIAHTETLRQFATAYAMTPGQPPDSQPTDAELRKTIDDFGDLARTAARAGALDNVTQDVAARASEAREALKDAEPLLRNRLNLFTNTEDVLATRAILDHAKTLVIDDAPAELKRSGQARFFILGGMQSTELAAYDLRQLVQLRQWLKRRIGGGVASDCKLLADFEAIQVNVDDPNKRTALLLARRQLLEILRRYVQACFCAALLPPCPPCDDTAVLLACLTVEECEVVEVCNLARTFVLSWPAMRYWVPWFSQIGALAEKMCCPPEPVVQAGKTKTGFASRFGSSFYEAMELREQRGGVLTRSAAVAAGSARLAPFERALRFAAPAGDAGADRLAHMLSRSILPDEGELPAAFEAAVVPQGEPLAEALRSPEPRRLLNELITDRVEELRPPTDLTNIVDEVDARLKAVDKTVADLTREIKRRPTTSDLAVAPPVRKLVTTAGDMNKRIEKVNADLLAQVNALQRRIEQLEEK